MNLARRAVACPRWLWMPGMRALPHGVGGGPERLHALDEHSPHCDETPASIAEAGWFLPDLDDPATLGCLMALVREAWTRPGEVGPRPMDIGFGDLSAFDTLERRAWVQIMGAPRFDADTLAEALVAALEAVP